MAERPRVQGKSERIKMVLDAARTFLNFVYRDQVKTYILHLGTDLHKHRRLCLGNSIDSEPVCVHADSESAERRAAEAMASHSFRAIYREKVPCAHALSHSPGHGVRQWLAVVHRSGTGQIYEYGRICRNGKRFGSKASSGKTPELGLAEERAANV